MTGSQASDIRDQLREDHEQALAGLEALRREPDEHRCKARLFHIRQAWMVHALAEETVVYRALEGGEAANSPHPADERFVEHELVGGLFEKLNLTRHDTHEWHARLNVLLEIVERHIEKERVDTFARLGERFSPAERVELGERFRLAAEKLALLEDAKAA